MKIFVLVYIKIRVIFIWTPKLIRSSYLNGKKIKFWKVNTLPLENTNAENGTVIKSDSKEGLFIKAKDGIIQVLEIQGENAKKMCIQDFLRGNEIKEGTVLK